MAHRFDNQRKLRLGVVFGGRSAEHDVSLRSAITVMSALDPERFEIIPIGITRSGQWLSGGNPLQALTAVSPMFNAPGDSRQATVMQQDRSAGDTAADFGIVVSESAPGGFAEGIDVVIPILHGPMGEDGTIQGLLELADVAYVGSGVLGSAVAMDKAVAKALLDHAGLPQLPWMLVTRSEWRRHPVAIATDIAESLGFPCFVKPANLGSSVGISKVKDPGSLANAMQLAARHDRRIVVERGANAREIEMAVLGNDNPIASIAGEVAPHGEFYDYDAKYLDDTADLIIPADVTPDQLHRMQKLAIEAFKVLDLAGMARVDFFLDRNTGELAINEVNTIPGFTSISMYPMLWEASGVPLSELVERLIALALERHAEMH